jgi:endo-1,4-beta-xylanase
MARRDDADLRKPVNHNRSLSRREIIAGGAFFAAIFGGASSIGQAQNIQPIQRQDIPSLGALARSKGLLYGAALDVTWMKDEGMMSALRTDCNVIGVANGFNWTRTQARPGMPLDLGQAEAVYNFAHSNGHLARGHNLIWVDDALPKWVLAQEDSMSASQAGDLMMKHVRDSMTPFKGRLIQQDVICEPNDSHGLQSTIWSRKLGERYLDLAMEASLEADPDSLRILNQSIIEQDSRYHEMMRTVLLRLIEGMMKRGAPIQALGIEGHLDASYTFSERAWRGFLDEIVGMGLQLMIVEYDVLDRGISGGIAERDAGVASLMKAFLDVTLSYPQCLGMVSQTYADRNSWLFVTPNKQRPDGQILRPDPLDANYKRKPMWHAIAAAIQSAPRRQGDPRLTLRR